MLTSLSIEGYQVTPQLIERVRGGAWDPERHPPDAAQRDALAARGYYESFEAVKKTVADILAGKNPGMAVRDEHGDWHRALFAPSIRAGILGTTELAGYRTGQVFIRNARHVPPRPSAVRDLMPALFDLLSEEEKPAVRAVLGALPVRLHTPLHGRQRPPRKILDECHACLRGLSLVRSAYGKQERVHGGVGNGQRGRRHRALCAVRGGVDCLAFSGFAGCVRACSRSPDPIRFGTYILSS